LKHPVAFYFLGERRYQAFAINVDPEFIFGPVDDFVDMERLVGMKQYVVDDTHLGPTFSSGFKAGLFPLPEEMPDGF